MGPWKGDICEVDLHGNLFILSVLLDMERIPTGSVAQVGTGGAGSGMGGGGRIQL